MKSRKHTSRAATQLLNRELGQPKTENFIRWPDFKIALEKAYELWDVPARDIIERYNTLHAKYSVTKREVLPAETPKQEAIEKIVLLEHWVKKRLKTIPLTNEAEIKKTILDALKIQPTRQKSEAKKREQDHVLNSSSGTLLSDLVCEAMGAQLPRPTPNGRAKASLTRELNALPEEDQQLLFRKCWAYNEARTLHENAEKDFLPLSKTFKKAVENFFENYVIPAAESHIREAFGRKKTMVVCRGSCSLYAEESWQTTKGYYVRPKLLTEIKNHLRSDTAIEAYLPPHTMEIMETAIRVASRKEISLKQGEYTPVTRWNPYDDYYAAIRPEEAKSPDQILKEWDQRKSAIHGLNQRHAGLLEIHEKTFEHLCFIMTKKASNDHSIPENIKKVFCEALNSYPKTLKEEKTHTSTTTSRVEALIINVTQHLPLLLGKDNAQLIKTYQELGQGVLSALNTLKTDNSSIGVDEAVRRLEAYQNKHVRQGSVQQLAVNYVLEGLLAAASVMPQAMPKLQPNAASHKPAAIAAKSL